MKLTQNAIIHALLGLAVLIAMLLIYLVLAMAHHGRPMLSPSGWILFGGAALVLVLATFLPSFLRRLRGLPPPPQLSPADIRFSIMVVLLAFSLVLCSFLYGMWWLSTIAIMLPPLSFLWRDARKRQRE